MRIRLYLLFAFLTPYFSAFGQTFFPVGDPVVLQEMAPEQANEVYLYFNNPSGDTLRLRWRRLEVNKPNAWDIDLCDYGTCYIGIPSNSDMSFVYDTIQPYLKLIVQPGQTPGAAWLWFRVYELDNEDNFQDVYFSLHTPGVTATDEPVQPVPFEVFPNPATDMVYLTSESKEPVVCRVFDTFGRLMFEKNHLLQTSIATADWPAGIYWINLGGENRQLCITH
ncbi:MAG: T9SS type A sorting domain-containing protein [Saprospiraceae bacterium]|nr:T9SS type A sorting domain-containing protein [Saprospiraceae bacterium]